MQLESKKHLEDIRRASQSILEFIEGHTFSDYSKSDLLRSATERQFEIIGEALNRLKKTDINTANMITDYGQVIAFRNILIHGYDVIEDAVVWDVIQKKLPIMIARLRKQRQVMQKIKSYWK